MTVVAGAWKPGMVIRKDVVSGSRVAKRFRVLDPPFTRGGKLRIQPLHLHPDTPETTTWWKTPESLPKGYYIEVESDLEREIREQAETMKKVEWPCTNCGLAWNQHFAHPPGFGFTPGEEHGALTCPGGRKKSHYVPRNLRELAITHVWNNDPEEGEAWHCPDCPMWHTIGGNAGYHASETGHGIPYLAPIPPPTVSEATCWLDGVRYTVRVNKDPQGITKIVFTSSRPPQGLDGTLYEFEGRLPSNG